MYCEVNMSAIYVVFYWLDYKNPLYIFMALFDREVGNLIRYYDEMLEHCCCAEGNQPTCH